MTGTGEKDRKRKPYGIFNATNKRKFLKELRRTCNVTIAAYKVGITKRCATDHKKKDAEFSAAWEDAIDEGIDLMEESARERAFDGVKEDVYYQGNPCGKINKFSDGLTTFMLKANRPEKFREHSQVDLNHKGGVLIIPSGTGSVENWLKENSAKMEVGGDDEKGVVDD